MSRTSPRAAAVTALLLAVCWLAPLSAGAEPRAELPVSYDFLAGAIRAVGQPGADPPGGNDWDCRPSAAHPRPVVLVHGTAGNKNTNWQTYAPLLANHGYCVFALTYGVRPGSVPPADQLGGMTRMQDSAAELKAFVERVLRATGADEVDLLGHSQGTLMPQYYVKFLGGADRVRSYVSLAPLWRGSALATPISLLAAVFGVDEDDVPLCTACAQFAPRSRFLRELHAGGLATPGVEYTNIMTRYDQLVIPYDSGRVPGMRNVVVQEHCRIDFSEHLEIAADPVGAQVVLNSLDSAHPEPVPCLLVLPFTGPVG